MTKETHLTEPETPEPRPPGPPETPTHFGMEAVGGESPQQVAARLVSQFPRTHDPEREHIAVFQRYHNDGAKLEGVILGDHLGEPGGYTGEWVVDRGGDMFIVCRKCKGAPEITHIDLTHCMAVGPGQLPPRDDPDLKETALCVDYLVVADDGQFLSLKDAMESGRIRITVEDEAPEPAMAGRVASC